MVCCNVKFLLNAALTRLTLVASVSVRKDEAMEQQRLNSSLDQSLPGLGLALGAGAGIAIGVAIAGGPGIAIGAAVGAGLGLVVGAIAHNLSNPR
jgi:hypothetical protein